MVLITDETLILDHVIMEFFREDPTELGCSIIYVADVLSSLSENIQTVISIKDRNQGQLLLQEGFFESLTSNWITSLKAMTRKPSRVALPH